MKEMLDSVLAQTYGNWQLCLADGSPKGEDVAGIVKKYASRDSRILYKNLGETGDFPTIPTRP